MILSKWSDEMKYFLIALYLILVPPLHAESFTKVTKISGLTSNGLGVRVVLDHMLEAEGCKNQGYYYLDVSNDPGKIMMQLLLAVKSNNEKVSIQIDGCVDVEDRQYPVITHVYYCDSEYCS